MSEDLFNDIEEHRPRRKGKKFTMNLSPEEAEFLETLAAALGKDQKEVIMEALHQYAQGKIVNWREIRGDHILAAFAIIRESAKIIDFLNRTSVRRQISEIAEHIRGTKQLYDTLREMIPSETSTNKKEGEQSNDNNDMLTQIFLGIAYKLGLIEPVPITEISGEEEE